VIDVYRCLLGLLCLLIFCILSGCWTGKELDSQSNLVVPKKWSVENCNNSSDSKLDLGWYVVGGDELLSLIRKSFKENRGLWGAYARLLSAKADYSESSGKLLPELEGELSFTRTSPSGGSFQGQILSGPFSQYSLGINLNWEIDLFRALQARRQASHARLALSATEMKAMRLKLAGDISRCFITYSYYRLQNELNRMILENQKALFGIRNVSYRAGLISTVQLQEVQAALNDAELSILEVGNTNESVVADCTVALGRLPGDGRLLLAEATKEVKNLRIPSVSGILHGRPSEILLSRPDIIKAQAALKATKFEHVAAVRDLFPRFSLGAALGRLSFTESDLLKQNSEYWSIVPGLHFPIFSRLRLSSSIKKAHARYQEALAQYEDSVIRALSEVEMLVRQMHSNYEQIEAIKKNVKIFRSTYNTVLRQEKAGLSQYGEVLEKQRLLLNMRTQLLKACFEYNLKLIRLIESVGG
jgi:NodT family efflux transporter outer membrane factor (OMF) lipoprotein